MFSLVMIEDLACELCDLSDKKEKMKRSVLVYARTSNATHDHEGMCVYVYVSMERLIIFDGT